MLFPAESVPGRAEQDTGMSKGADSPDGHCW